jgi:hypothetical protein
MKFKLTSVCLVAVALAGSTTIAAAQGGSTDRNGNAIGSQHVGNGAASTGGAMQKETTGMSRPGSSQDSPNGSASAPPTSKQGPGGDPSKNNDAPK